MEYFGTWNVDYIVGQEGPYYPGMESYTNSSLEGKISPYNFVFDLMVMIKNRTGNTDIFERIKRKITDIYEKIFYESREGVYIIQGNTERSSEDFEEYFFGLEHLNLGRIYGSNKGIIDMIKHFGLEKDYERLLGLAMFGSEELGIRSYNNFLRIFHEKIEEISGPARTGRIFVLEPQFNSRTKRAEKNGKYEPKSNDKKIWSKRRGVARKVAKKHGKPYLNPKYWDPSIILPKTEKKLYLNIPPLEEKMKEIKKAVEEGSNGIMKNAETTFSWTNYQSKKVKKRIFPLDY